jgi:hypothetical protein
MFHEGVKWAKQGKSMRVPQWVDGLAAHEYELFMLGAESIWNEGV